MKSKPSRNDKLSDQDRAAIDELLGKLFTQARAQFGSAVKSFWFHDGDLCPGCMERRLLDTEY